MSKQRLMALAMALILTSTAATLGRYSMQFNFSGLAWTSLVLNAVAWAGALWLLIRNSATPGV